MFYFFPVATAYAEGAAPAQPAGAGLLGMLPLILLFVIFYFLLIRPQQKKMKQHKDMVSKLSKGDEVVTSGGMYGRITAVADETVTIEIAKDVRVKLSKESVGRKKGS